MRKYIRIIVSKFIRKIGYKLIASSDYILNKKSKLLKRGEERNLYKTCDNVYFWLNTTGYVDKCILETGVFEPYSTALIRSLIKEGDVVLDVGANIGYYSVIMSKLVGESGKVIAFEPTNHFGKYLQMSLNENHIDNVQVVKLGLSNKNQDILIDIGVSSATLHSEPLFDPIISEEMIQLMSLDEFIEQHPLPKIDFIKIDVDGHEPLFFEGAWTTLEKFDPVIILEISHLHFLNAGYTAWDFYEILKRKNYKIFHEKDLSEIKSKDEFLIKCGNFSQSTNIVISKNELIYSN